MQTKNVVSFGKNLIASRSKLFLFGLTLPLRSLGLLLKNPRLMVFSAIPFLISLTLSIWIVSALQGWVVGHLQAFILGFSWTHSEWAQTWVLLPLQFLVKIGLWLLGAVFFSGVGGLICVPFNDFLAEAVEPRVSPALSRAESASFFSRRYLRIITLDLAKTLFSMGMGLTALLLSWVPVINVIAITFSFLLLCFQFTSYSQTRREWGVLQGVQFLFQNFWMCLGLGMACSVMFAIPLVSALGIPLAVISGTWITARGIHTSSHA